MKVADTLLYRDFGTINASSSTIDHNSVPDNRASPPKCNLPMEGIAPIEDVKVITRILD